MRTTALLTAAMLVSVAAAEQLHDVNERLPTFTYKGVPVSNSILERAGLEEGIVRLETGGLIRIRLETLPEPARSKYYSLEAVAKVHSEKQAKQAAAVAAAEKREQEKKQKQFEAELAQAEKLRNAIQKHDPVRVHDSALYDFTEFLLERQKQVERVRWLLSGYVSDSDAEEAKTITARLQKSTSFFVCGKVMSVHKEGILVRTHDDGPLTIVFVMNLPTATQLVDDDAVNACVLPRGRYQYKAVNGSVKTIPLYDYGTPIPQATTNSYQEVKCVNSEGTEVRRISTVR